LRSPYRVRLSARTVRRLDSLMKENAFAKQLTIPTALLVVYVLLSFCLCLYFFNTKASYGEFLGLLHMFSSIFFIVIAISFHKPPSPEELQINPTPFLIDYVAIYVATAFFGFIIAAIISANLLITFVVISIITFIYTVIRQLRDRPMYAQRKAAFNYDQEAMERAKQWEEKNIQEERASARARKQKQQDDARKLSEERIKRKLQIEELENELASLKNVPSTPDEDDDE
jgi:signal transduction histidine kinase